MYKNFWKRIFDICLSLLGIIVLAIPMLVIALVIKHDDAGPVLFKQTRFGKEQKLFTIYKFRSMKLSAPDVPTHLLENPEQYITRSGRVLRRLRLDELPQLFNIFLGQMSFVGPRPALWSQEDLIAEREKYGANHILPGLTGWAQINGCAVTDDSVKAKFDGEYTENISFLFDLKIFFATFLSVLQSDGIAQGLANTEDDITGQDLH